MSTSRNGSSQQPPGFLRLTGHPLRWQLMSELARSDRQVRELSALVGGRQSLTSYHLAQLRDGGVVRQRRSSADGRDTYYSLDLEVCREMLAEAGAALHPGLQLVPPDASPRGSLRSPVRVLFLCTGNSSRSQIAEALLQELGGERVEVVSAGSHPKSVHADAIRIMSDRGLDISRHHSKHLGEFSDGQFDYVISLCDKVREVCPEFPGEPEVVHWSIPDPSAQPDGYPAFVRTAEELEVRIRYLLHLLDSVRSVQGGR